MALTRFSFVRLFQKCIPNKYAWYASVFEVDFTHIDCFLLAEISGINETANCSEIESCSAKILLWRSSYLVDQTVLPSLTRIN